MEAVYLSEIFELIVIENRKNPAFFKHGQRVKQGGKGKDFHMNGKKSDEEVNSNTIWDGKRRDALRQYPIVFPEVIMPVIQ